MTGANTFAASRMLQAIGVKGGRLPKVALSTYQPVLVMGDFSKTLASEPLEARGYAAEHVAGVAGQSPAFAIHSAGPGGIIIEGFRMTQPTISAAVVLVNVALSVDDLWTGFGTADVQNIGGRPANSVVRIGSTAGPLVMPGQSTVTAYGKRVDFTGHRIYVTAGSFLNVQSAHIGYPAGIEIVWRELAEPIGGS